MRVVISFLLASMILVSGCSTGSPAGSSAASIPASITGNWTLSATSSNTSTTSLINTMGGTITSSGGTVSGTIHVVNTVTAPSVACYSLSQNIPITGTYSSSSGAFTAVSSAVSGQILTISGTMVAGSVNSAVLTAGTYSVTGGCDNGDKGTLTGYTAVSYSSGYLGEFYSGVVKGGSGTLVVASGISAIQSGPDANGFYHVTGTAVFSGSTCTTTAVTTSLSPGTITASTIAGPYMSITITDTNGNVLTFTGYANNGFFGNVITGTYATGANACYPSGDNGAATLTS